jgi:hypothetical protein
MSERVLYLEPVGGIAGDMFLAAALDLGVPLGALEAPLRTLGLEGWRFEVTRATRHGIVGTHVDVVLEHSHGDHEPPHSHEDHEHSHSHGDHEHSHSHDDHEHEHSHSHEEHRGWREIDALISNSRLSERAKANASKVFRLLGEAEAKVHGVSLEEIHFHEVGAVDSIIDICGAAVALELLGSPRVLCSPPPLGSGTARISHGVVPVPVPATLELLRGVPVRFEGLGELTTPTGAALLKAFATVGRVPELVVERVGYGVGTKDWPDRANVLRASLAMVSGADAGTLAVLECNLDDCSPQVLGALVETLLARGALDAWITPVVMKKGRPGHVVAVLSTLDTKQALERTLLEESTTLGVRETRVDRTVLERRWETVTTPWGPVRMKLGLLGARVLNAAPEFEDCRAAAQRAGVPLKDVLAEAVAAFRRAGR